MSSPLAVVTSSGLRIVSSAGTVAVAGPGAESPAWAPDGQSLAYLDNQQLWVADRAGRARRLLDEAIISFAWSPVGGSMAAVPLTDGRPGGLIVVDQAGRAMTVVGPDFLVSGYKWAPDGTAIAYSQAVPPMSAGPGTRTDGLYVRYLPSAASTRIPYDPGAGNGILLGAWWPDQKGLYLWSDPQHSGSIASDGLDLEGVSIPDGHRTGLGITLPLPGALTFSPNGSEVAIMKGGSRFISETKNLALCRTGTAQCSELPQPPGTVSAEPSWSPDGKQIVFIRAAATQTPDTTAWLPTTRLYIYSVDSGTDQMVPGSPSSVGYPQFTPSGEEVIFQHDTRLSTISIDGGNIRQVAMGLPPLYTQWGGTPPYALAISRSDGGRSRRAP